jgi:hypothetical protein
VEARLTFDLPSLAQQTAESLTNAEAIARFQARVPRAGTEHGWRIAEVGRKFHGEGADRRELVVIDVANDGAPFAAPELLIESTGVRYGKAMLKGPPAADRLRFYAPLYSVGANAGGDLVLTLIDGPRAGTFTVPAPR